MKILIITDKFILGGLESQIIGYVNHLSSLGHELYLAVGDGDRKYIANSGFKDVEYLGELSNKLNSCEFIKIIENVRRCISEWKIDVIHTHPFISHIIGGVAAKLEKKMHVISLHGPASIPNYFGYIYILLFKYIILPSAEKILCVSEETRDLLPLSLLKKDKLLICRNAVDVHSFIPSENTTQNLSLYGQWVFISRLDEEKSTGLIDFAIKAKSIGITGLTVIGDGPYKVDLMLKLNELSLSDFVELKPASFDIKSNIHKYSGVAGMGRVILEACASGKPAFLVGYDGVKGAVQTTLLLHARRENYSGRGLDNISAEEMRSDLNTTFHEGNLKYNRCYIYKYANEANVWGAFINELTKANITEEILLVDLFVNLKKSNDYFEIFNSNHLLLKLSEIIYVQYESLSLQQRQLLPLINCMSINNNDVLIEDYKKQLKQAREYIEDKEIYIAKLKAELQKIMSVRDIDSSVIVNNP